MYPAIVMMGTNTMVGLCSEKKWNKVYGKREHSKDGNYLLLGSTF